MLAIVYLAVFVALQVQPTTAFVPTDFITPYVRNDADWVSRAFAYNGPDAQTHLKDGLAKSASGTKNKPASVMQDIKDQRQNGYKIVTAANPSRTRSAAINQDGTDFSYFSPATFGSSQETMSLLLDTGSPDTWIMGDSCTDRACKLHSTFGSSDSTTTRKTGASFKLQYGDGTVSGFIVNDTVSIGGMKLEMPFGIAKTVSDNFNNYPMDGILGLARVPADFDAPTFLQALAVTKLLPTNMFGINLQRQVDGTADGEISFGAIDSSKFQGDVTYTDTTPNFVRWEIPADDIVVDGKPCGLTGRNAVIDTGTSYLLIPGPDAKIIFSRIRGAETSDSSSWLIPCDTTVSLQIVFSGVGYDISPKDYVGPSAGGDNLCATRIIGMAAVSGDQNAWLLGDTFLKNVYSIYDADNHRVGFGAKTGRTVYPAGSLPSSTSSVPSAVSNILASVRPSSSGSGGDSAPGAIHTGGVVMLPGTGVSTSTSGGNANGTTAAGTSTSTTSMTHTSSGVRVKVSRFWLTVLEILFGLAIL